MRTFLHARQGAWRILVSCDMWPGFPIASPRMFGRFVRWINKADERVRISC